MKNLREEHAVSSFTLDVHFAAGQPADPALEAHVAGCERCQAYLRYLGELQKQPAPTWEPGARAPQNIRKAPGLARWALLGGGVATLVLASGIASKRLAMHAEATPYVGVKGSPAVQVIVQSHGEVRIWDGSARVQAGDALALKVDCQDYKWVSVVTPSEPSGQWTRLSETECPKEAGVLPFSLVVDDAAGSERFAVVLSARTLGNAELQRLTTASTRSNDAWVVRLVVPK